MGRVDHDLYTLMYLSKLGRILFRVVKMTLDCAKMVRHIGRLSINRVGYNRSRLSEYF